MIACRCADVDHLIANEATACERSHRRELGRVREQSRALYMYPVTGRLWLET